MQHQAQDSVQSAQSVQSVKSVQSAQSSNYQNQAQWSQVNEFTQYQFNLKNGQQVLNHSYGFIYQGFQVVNPKNRVFIYIQNVDKPYKGSSKQIVRTTLEDQLRKGQRMTQNEQVQIIFRGQAGIRNQTTNTKIRKQCTIMKIVEASENINKSDQQDDVIKFRKFQFSLKDKMEGENSLGVVYKGFQTYRPTNSAYIIVLKKPYRQHSEEEIRKSVEELEKNTKIEENWKIAHHWSCKAQVSNEDLNEWVNKQYMILRLTQYSQVFDSQVDQPQDIEIIRLKGGCQFNQKNEPLGKGSIGFFYEGCQTAKPSNKKNPIQMITQEEIEKSVQELEKMTTIDKKWTIGHFDGGQIRIFDHCLMKQTNKYCLVLQLLEISDYQKQKQNRKESPIVKSQRSSNKENSIQNSHFTKFVAQGNTIVVDTPITKNKVLKIDKYQFNLNQFLGRGGFGAVFQGFQTYNPSNKVAVKVVSSNFQDLSKKDKQILNEQIKIMKHLNPNYAVKLLYEGQTQVYDIQRNKNTILKCLVMERMDGTIQNLYQNDLKPLLEKNKQKGIKLVKQYFFAAVRAYMACFQNNIVHKDLKPQNILIKKREVGYQIKISDFGLSMHQTITPIKGNEGTKFYLSPQQVNNQGYTHKCDVFAFGNILIYLILGRHSTLQQLPFDNQYLQSIKFLQKCLSYQQKQRYSYDQLLTHKYFGDIIDKNQYSQIIQKCLSYQQQDRYQYEQVLTHAIFAQIKDKYEEDKLLNQVGKVLTKKGYYYKALNYLEKAVQLQLKIKGKNSIDTASTLINIGQVYANLRDNKKALKIFEECLEIQQRIKGKRNIHTVKTLNNIAFVYRQQEDYEEALKNYKQSLEIQQKFNENGSIDTATILNNIGLVQIRLEHFNNAIKNFEKSLEIQQKIKGKGSIETAMTLNNIGSVYKKKQKYKKALRKYLQCLQIQQKIKGKGSIDTATTLNNIGSVYKELGKYQKALKNYEQCLKIEQQIKGKGSFDTATTLNNIGSVNKALGNYKNALKNYEQCLEIQYKINGKQSIDTATALKNIGLVYDILGDCENSLKCFQQSLEILQKIKRKGSILTQLDVSINQVKAFIAQLRTIVPICNQEAPKSIQNHTLKQDMKNQSSIQLNNNSKGIEELQKRVLQTSLKNPQPNNKKKQIY